MESSDPVDIPTGEKSKLDEDTQRKVVDPTHYHGMVGTLMYLTAIRPDLTSVVCTCARYQTSRNLIKDMLPLREDPKEGKLLVKELLKLVLLNVPRKNNMYSVDMKNIVPKECLTCLVAKVTLDESMLWHRRLGHVNFKTINKLVKENLVRGLPLKRFENDQTCVACLKGKQLKAS
ncbi:putative ribonuclease H-like domain-containing protein, partial [Tanacetum coccineum]